MRSAWTIVKARSTTQSHPATARFVTKIIGTVRQAAVEREPVPTHFPALK
jgi:hypothetical protein